MLTMNQCLVFLFPLKAMMWRLRAEVDTFLAFGCSRHRLESEAGWEEKRPGSERCKTSISAGALGLFTSVLMERGSDNHSSFSVCEDRESEVVKRQAERVASKLNPPCQWRYWERNRQHWQAWERKWFLATMRQLWGHGASSWSEDMSQVDGLKMKKWKRQKM